jgi:hypothetical protein
LADNIKDFIIAFILIGLFALCFVSFIYQASQDNNPQSELLNDSRLSPLFTNLNSTLNTYQNVTTEQKNSFMSDNPLVEFGSMISLAIVGTGKVFANIIVGTWDILTTFITTTLGVPPVVIGIIFSIILISVIFMIWQNWRQGK